MPLETIALIPARRGSKGLPGKNTRVLCGKPLVAWTIEAALASPKIDKVFVSSDCELTAEIAKKLGAELPNNSLRPAELAEDTTSGMTVVRHLLDVYQKPCNLVLLQPTSPLRQAMHINEALSLFESHNNQDISVVSVCEAKPLSWQGTIDANTGLWQRIKTSDNAQTRQLVSQAYYQLNGAIYIAASTKLIQHDFITAHVLPYIMQPEYSVDIDTLVDFHTAESLMQQQLKQNNNIPVTQL